MRTAIAWVIALALAAVSFGQTGGAYGLPPHVYLFPVSSTSTGEFRFLAGNSSTWVALRAPVTVSNSVPFVLPATAGTNGQFLQTDGTGVTSWASLPDSLRTGQITWSFIDVNQDLSEALDVPFIYPNRAKAFTVTEVWCRNDAGTAVIMIQKNGVDLLTSNLTCSPTGNSTTSFSSPSVAVGDRLGHVSVTLTGVRQLNVAIKYTVN